MLYNAELTQLWEANKFPFDVKKLIFIFTDDSKKFYSLPYVILWLEVLYMMTLVCFFKQADGMRKDLALFLSMCLFRLTSWWTVETSALVPGLRPALKMWHVLPKDRQHPPRARWVGPQKGLMESWRPSWDRPTSRAQPQTVTGIMLC